MSGRPRQRGERAADLALAGAIAAACCALASDVVPWPWLAGHAAPAIVLLLARRALRRPWAVVLVALLALFAASTALRATVPASEAAPVASILAAPLAFFALRRAPGDRRHALFLSLCLLVIGSVLDGARARPFAVAFAVCAAATLVLDGAARTRAGARHLAGPASLARRAWHASRTVAVCVLTAACLFELLCLAPVPQRRHGSVPAATAAATRRTPGLSSQFDFSESDGWLDAVRDLQAPVLATVRRDDGPVPPDLYLRYVHFDLAGANRWATGKFVRHRQPTAGRWHLLPGRHAGATYTVERAPLADGRLLLPVGAFAVEGIDGLVGHSDLGLLEERVPSADDVTYRVHVLPAPDRLPTVDLTAMHLLSLPEALLADAAIARLAERYVREGGATSPFARALAIAAGLRRDYRYERRDPTGPGPDVLHNFLFHARAGYCMHFASALAVMLRLQRIPCRIGAGLYGGRPGDIEGERLYGEADAHAWVEVPCVGRGYVVIDATPEAARAEPYVPMPDVPEVEPPASSASTGEAPGVPPWVLALAFLSALVLRPFAHGKVRERPQPHALPRTHPARAALERILARLSAAGVVRARSETLPALAARAARALPCDAGSLRAAFAAYEEVRFGGAPFDAERARRMADGLAGLADRRRVGADG